MSRHDLYNNLKVTSLLDPEGGNTAANGSQTPAVDTTDYHSGPVFTVHAGTLATALSAVLLESDEVNGTGLSGANTASATATQGSVSFTAGQSGVQKIGYAGGKKYAALQFDGTGEIAVLALQGLPAKGPVS